MAIITLRCDETLHLKLGPGTTHSWPGTPGQVTPSGYVPPTQGRVGGEDVIVFSNGYARFDEASFPDWRKWAAAPGTPPIEVIDSSTGEGDFGRDALACFECDPPRVFGNKGMLTIHRNKVHTPLNIPVQTGAPA